LKLTTRGKINASRPPESDAPSLSEPVSSSSPSASGARDKLGMGRTLIRRIDGEGPPATSVIDEFGIALLEEEQRTGLLTPPFPEDDAEIAMFAHHCK